MGDHQQQLRVSSAHTPFQSICYVLKDLHEIPLYSFISLIFHAISAMLAYV